MAPKRKRSRSRSPRRDRKKSRSPAKKSKTTTGAAAVKSHERKEIYSFGKQMNEALRREIRKHEGEHPMATEVLSLMEQYGDFHECDGPTNLGELCLKGSSYFRDEHKLNCRSYCTKKAPCLKWLRDLYVWFPNEIEVVAMSQDRPPKPPQTVKAVRNGAIYFKCYSNFKDQIYRYELIRIWSAGQKEYKNVPENEKKNVTNFENLWVEEKGIDREVEYIQFHNMTDPDAMNLFCDKISSMPMPPQGHQLHFYINCIYIIKGPSLPSYPPARLFLLNQPPTKHSADIRFHETEDKIGYYDLNLHIITL